MCIPIWIVYLVGGLVLGIAGIIWGLFGSHGDER